MKKLGGTGKAVDRKGFPAGIQKHGKFFVQKTAKGRLIITDGNLDHDGFLTTWNIPHQYTGKGLRLQGSGVK